MKYSERLATYEDLRAVEKIEQLTNPVPWSFASLESELNTEASNFWVLTDDETDSLLYGFLIFSITDSDAYIKELAINPEYQRKGMGKFLLRRMTNFLLRQDVKKVLLDVRVSNNSAINFYQQLSFIVIARRKRFYSNGDDAYTMQLLLQTLDDLNE